MPPLELLTMDEVAQRYRVSISTLNYWRKQGRGPKAMRLGRHVRYHRDDLLAWEQDCRSA